MLKRSSKKIQHSQRGKKDGSNDFGESVWKRNADEKKDQQIMQESSW